MQNAILSGSDLRGANLEKVKLLGAGSNFDKADFRGVRSNWKSYDSLENAAGRRDGLTTDLSGIILLDEEGNELDLDGERKKEWLRERGAIVDDLTAEEVRQLAIELGLRYDKDEPTTDDEPTPDDEPTTLEDVPQQSDDEPTTLEGEPQQPADEPIPQE